MKRKMIGKSEEQGTQEDEKMEEVEGQESGRELEELKARPSRKRQR